MAENQVPPNPPTRPIPPRPVVQNENVQPVATSQAVQPAGQQAEVKKTVKKEPLSDQSKSILFGLLGAFAVLGGIACLVVMLVI